MKTILYFIGLMSGLILLTGCEQAYTTPTHYDTSDYDKQTKAFWEQLAETSRQLEVSGAQQKILAEQLKVSEEQSKRFDKLLDLWEKQAARHDKILDAMEKNSGAPKP